MVRWGFEGVWGWGLGIQETIEIFIGVRVQQKENIITRDRIIWVHLIGKRKTHAGSGGTGADADGVGSGDAGISPKQNVNS
ncbi:hypothetical protein M0802_009443 [Mischocyttarus mexicanus]|nr:hypothetical protein M0802_009443 [Mischocyttarus mexicanus]